MLLCNSFFGRVPKPKKNCSKVSDGADLFGYRRFRGQPVNFPKRKFSTKVDYRYVLRFFMITRER